VYNDYYDEHIHIETKLVLTTEPKLQRF